MPPGERENIRAAYLELRLNSALKRIQQFKLMITVLKDRKKCHYCRRQLETPQATPINASEAGEQHCVIVNGVDGATVSKRS